MTRPLTVLDLPLATVLANSGPASVHAGLRAAIVDGRLPASTRLPSSRDLARQLGVRRNVIVSAYEQLLVDGLVETRTGDGTYVTSRLPSPVPVPVDGFGLDVAAGRKIGPTAKAAYVTPTHQFPTGVTMRMERRVALLEWAREAKAWIFEDDYDSEFRYDGPPLTALAGIDRSDRVIYIGTFSKMLFAGLRLAYVVVPPAVLERVVAARAAQDRFPPPFIERAISDLMVDGTLAAHIRRMRVRYRHARDITAQVLAQTARGTLQPWIPTQGLHMVAYLPPGSPKGAAAQIRTTADVQAWLLSETRMRHSRDDGFILGFAGHDMHELTAAASRLGNAARSFLDKRA